jgi:hypothetical protein
MVPKIGRRVRRLTPCYSCLKKVVYTSQLFVDPRLMVIEEDILLSFHWAQNLLLCLIRRFFSITFIPGEKVRIFLIFRE